MTSIQNIEQWYNCSLIFESGEYTQALQGFLEIANSSKILFNIGVIYQLLENHIAAVSAFNKAVKKDPYFSVAFFLRGISLQLLGQHDHSIRSFSDALEHMRGNDVIDYTQIGLAYQLYSCEIYYNCALTYAQMGNTNLAMTMLDNAVRCKQLPDHDIIDEAMKTGGQGFELFQLPPNLIFKPSASKVDALKKIDFSGSAKVIAALDPEDNFVEFKGYRYLGLDKKASTSTLDGNESKETESNSKTKTSTFRPRSSSTSSSSPPRRPITPTSSRTSNGSVSSKRSASLSVRSSNSSTYSQEKPPRPARPPLSPISPIRGNPRKPSLTVRPSRPASPPTSPQPYLPSPSKSDSSFRSSDKIRFKVNFDGKRLLMLPSNVTFKQLYYKIQEKIDADVFRIFYKDEEGEWMRLADDDDLAMALELSPESGKLEIWCR